MEFIFVRYSGLVLTGFAVSVKITVLAMIAGIIIGLFTALLALSKRRFFKVFSFSYTELARSTPAYVGIIWFTYVLPRLLNIRISPFWTAWIALTFQTSGYLAEVFRAGIEAIGKDQRLAARSLGLTHFQEMRYIVLPQAFRIMIPDIMNQFVVVFKTSTLVSAVAVQDLMYYAHRMASQLFKPVEIYTSAALMYIATVLILSAVSRVIERKARRCYHS